MSMSDLAPAPARVHPILWIIVTTMVGFELMFAAVDAGWAPESLGRDHIYYRFAFLDLLFDHWRGQVRIEFIYGTPEDTLRLRTFLTHAFLHGGWLHLAFNGAAFLGLGHAIVQAVGIARFLVIFAACAIAGALAFGLIAQANGPMVGASGAIFGFLGVVTAWQERALRLAGRSRAMIWKRIAGLVAINALLALGLGGLLAWEAHLGGWVAGWLLAGLFRPMRGPVSGF
ncbi:MAG TPA: rhomboid family intramembrane serine protease [Thermohalobaculum sp.]|nr:rhomboid family intramembrane serine protease [Thermohalobaculum sp.]